MNVEDLDRDIKEYGSMSGLQNKLYAVALETLKSKINHAEDDLTYEDAKHFQDVILRETFPGYPKINIL